tara:strand:- start:2762 stop:3508 length:747 start_codon:yes stop_codon:yes gene_type:complete
MKKIHGIVTGAGKGIGLSVVKKLLSENYSITAITRSKSIELENLKKKKINSLNIVYLDLNKIEEVSEEFKKIIKLKPSEFLINNAGIRSRYPLLKMSSETLFKVMNNNFMSAFLITKEYIKNIKKNKNTNHSIVSITSIVGPQGFSELSSYAASKGALEASMKSLAIEYGNKNIRINCVAPGFVKTSYYDDFKKNNPKLYKWTIEKTPMKRWGNVEEVANVVEFLVSEKSSFITGSTIFVDGGWTAGS